MPFIEEDLEIVPVHVCYPTYQLPDLTKLSQVEQELTLLVFSFLHFEANGQNWKAVYERIYTQIYAVKDWDQSLQLVYLHELMKAEEKRYGNKLK